MKASSPLSAAVLSETSYSIQLYIILSNVLKWCYRLKCTGLENGGVKLVSPYNYGTYTD